MWPRACARLTSFFWKSETEEGGFVKLHLPISSLCLGEVLAKTTSSLLKTVIKPISKFQRMHIGNLTLIPLPSLQFVDVISMNNNGRNFIFIDFVNIPSRFSCKSFSCVAQDEIDFTSYSLSGLRVIAYIFFFFEYKITF